MANDRLGILDRLLGYADRPWKVVALVISALVLGGGYALWEQRAVIAQRILETTVAPRLEPQRFPPIAQQLMDETRADAVFLTRINLSAGQLANVDGRLASDPLWRPKAEPRSMFDVATPLQIAEIIAGHVVCDDVPPTDGYRTDVGLGMKRRCIVGVPPVLEVLVGGLGIAWKEPLDKVRESGAKIEMARVAMKLATW